MKNKYKYLVTGFAIILFVLPMIVSSSQLPAPNEPRDCYKWGTTEGLYMCFEPSTGIYAMWFSSYIDMHEYYTPQLKEMDWSIGNQGVVGKRAVNLKIGAYTVGNMNDLEYSYVKNT